jgi:hypothetical protein
VTRCAHARHAQAQHAHAQNARAHAQHAHARAQHARARAFTVPAILAWLIMAMPTVASSHSASDAYLTLTTDGAVSGDRLVMHGQWDIALRDLDFVLELDDDGDGKVTWGEVRKHRAAIEGYAYRNLKLEGKDGKACSIEAQHQMIDDHADGAYAALFFDVVCARSANGWALGYTLFFDIDPSHRGIFVMHSGTNMATAVLSPQNARIDLMP